MASRKRSVRGILSGFLFSLSILTVFPEYRTALLNCHSCLRVPATSLPSKIILRVLLVARRETNPAGQSTANPLLPNQHPSNPPPHNPPALAHLCFPPNRHPRFSPAQALPSRHPAHRQSVGSRSRRFYFGKEANATNHGGRQHRRYDRRP